LYIAGALNFDEGDSEEFLFGKALQQPHIYQDEVLQLHGDYDELVSIENQYSKVASTFLEVTVDDESSPDFIWEKLTHTNQLNDNSLVRRTVINNLDEEE